MSSRKAAGFTIVELLVVITIIGIMMALLFPAINAARESARKANCINNEGQVGKAILTYTTSKGDFPKHLNVKSNGTAANDEEWPWVANIMTQLGRGDIADAMLPASGNASKHDPSTRTERIQILICPSDPPVNATDQQINYVANSGIEGLDDPIANGIFHQTNDVALAYVAKNDGTSTTLLLSENVDAGEWNDNGVDPDAHVSQTAIIWMASATTGCDLNENTKSGGCTDKDAARPRSNHSGGFVVTFCDGHTQFFSKEIGYDVYKLLMTPDGGSLSPSQAPLDEGVLK